MNDWMTEEEQDYLISNGKVFYTNMIIFTVFFVILYLSVAGAFGEIMSFIALMILAITGVIYLPDLVMLGIQKIQLKMRAKTND